MRQENVRKNTTQVPKPAANLTGIPAQMKLRFERRSGRSFDDVRVHYNSDKPAKIGALAYTQGNQVYIGPGQEQYLEHELVHRDQQERGIVHPTRWMNGLPINDSPSLERDADNGILSGPVGVPHEPVIQGKFSTNEWLFSLLDSRSNEARKIQRLKRYANQPYFYDRNEYSGSSGFAEIFLTRKRGYTTSPIDLKWMRDWTNYLTSGENQRPVNLLEDPNTGYTLTRMHLINGWLFGPSAVENMVLGPQESNHKHLTEAEDPIKNFLYLENKNRYVEYEVSPGYAGFPPSMRRFLRDVRDYDREDYIKWVESCCPRSLCCRARFYVEEPAGYLLATGWQKEIICMNQ